MLNCRCSHLISQLSLLSEIHTDSIHICIDILAAADAAAVIEKHNTDCTQPYVVKIHFADTFTATFQKLVLFDWAIRFMQINLFTFVFFSKHTKKFHRLSSAARQMFLTTEI